MSCLSEEQLLRLLDGGVAPNEASGLRAHIDGCAACRASWNELESMAEDFKAPVDFDADEHVASVMRRVVAVPDGAAKRRSRLPALAVAATSALALAAALALFVRTPSGAPLGSSPSGFTARGAAANPTLARDVGVELFAGTTDLVRLKGGEPVVPDTAFTMAYTNVHPGPAYLLLFAVDAANTVHWLYPAYTSQAEDPSSVPLAPADREHAMPTSVILDAPSQGDLRVVTIVTEGPRHVSEIETRAPDALAHEALEQAFPHGVVTELRLHVEKAVRP